VKPIDFYFDFASPYAWFAWKEFRRIAQAHSRSVRYRPMLLWAVLQARGMPPPLEHEAKKSYLLHDMQRSARYMNVPFRMPDAFPTSSHLPARLLLQLQQNGDARAVPLAQAVLGGYFESNIDLRDAQTLVRVGTSLGLDPAWVSEALAAETGKRLLQDANAEAVAAGVWGSPYIIVDGEAFFGADRLPQLDWFLAEAARSAKQA
jgi:2-hydroxychromene-2-carboxylate isomerase